MNLLDTSAGNFFDTPAGIAVISVALVAVLILIIELNYKFFAKYLLDFIFAVIAVIICSPVYLACALISKYRGKGEPIIEKKACLGAKGKIIYVHNFRNLNKLTFLPRLVDVLCGRMSFVGIKLIDVTDGALIADEDMARFGTRPGLICHLAGNGDDRLTYEEMFESDVKYCAKRGFFRDIWIILRAAAGFFRGEGKSYLGEAADKSYAQVLLECGVISQDDVKRAEELAEKAISDSRRAKNFKTARRKIR